MRLPGPLRRVVDYVWDNPSAELDARGILSSPKVGLWLGLEVLLIIIASWFALFVFPEDSGLRRVMVDVGTGPFLTVFVLGAVTLFLTLVVPIRALGLFDGPRWRGYLDQLVTTGITPMRYFAGKWATSQLFFLALLAATLPFVTLYGLLGGVSLGRTVLAYVLLWAYCNLLLFVAVGFGVVAHEGMALAVTWLLFSVALIADLTPLPSCAACLTPLRFLIQPLVSAIAGSASPTASWLYFDAHILGLDIPWPVWALTVWSTIAVAVTLTCLVGPLHTFAPGLNNFGAVVLPGDGRRAFFRRMRPFVTRRVELAFLFENRGPALSRLSLPLRAAVQVLFLGLLVACILPLAFDPKLLAGLHDLDDILGLHAGLFSGVFFFAVFALRSGRQGAAARATFGGVRVPLVVLDAGVFIVFAALVTAFVTCGFATSWSDLQALSTGQMTGYSVDTAERLVHASLTTLDVVIATAAGGFLVMKLVGTRTLSEDQAFFAGVAYAGALMLLPILALALGKALDRADDPTIEALALPAMFFGLPSPIAHVMFTAYPRGSSAHVYDTWLMRNGHWLWQAGGLLNLVLLGVASHLALWREHDLLDRSRDAPAAAGGPIAPCPRCEGRLAVPAGRTAWGGILGTWLAGAVRCVECHEEYLGASGRAPGLRGALIGLARAGVFLLLFGALLAVVVATLAGRPT